MICRFLGLLALFCAAHAVAVDKRELLAQLPEPELWLRQVQDELLPWWRQPAALGQPVGRFPTFRCADGSVYQAARPCPELAQGPKWIREELGREYVRMQSRQVFVYATAFHLSGDPQLLQWARAGVADIRARALDRRSGSPASWYQDGRPQPAVGERTAQDIAYAGLALAAVYYVTHDEALLQDLDRLHRHLMSYYDAERRQLRWTLAGPDKDRQELVAQLDPLNAYMVLVTPLTRGERQRRWQADMRRLVAAIREHYCPGEGPRCLGTLGLADSAAAGARHNDFGHSGKALWMLSLAARQLHDAELDGWASTRAHALLRQAYIESTGSWASRWRDDGVEPGKSWWIYAELDQLASSLALRDISHAQYLRHSWRFWNDYFIDRRGGEVWGWVSAAGYPGSSPLKQHHWKNGYHSIEHALIGYLTSAALHGRPATLYYAGRAGRSRAVQPYFFEGRVTGRKTLGRGIVAVSFALPQPALDGQTAFDLPAPLPFLPIRGERRPLNADRLPLLVGEWSGSWRSEDGTASGPCRWTIERATADGVEARVSGCAAAAEGERRVQGRGKLVDGGVQLPLDAQGGIGEAQLSEEGGQSWLQWHMQVDGRRSVVELRKAAP